MTDETSGKWGAHVSGSKSASDIAREAIPLLEKAIKERFGMKVLIGAELEFSVTPSQRVKKLTIH